jgi:glycosyltransferase involved in cell wall biosynthesis
MGVDVDGFAPTRRSQAVRAQLLRRTGGDRHSRLLFYAGRLSPEKNLELLTETLERLSAPGEDDYRFVIAGHGPRAEWLRARCNREPLRGRVAFLGSLERDALAACYASADVFVHPNAREPFGIGPLEAMASGIPVVVPNAGGVLTYANESNAWLAEPTAEAFASAIRSAVLGDHRRVRAAATTAQTFRWSEATRRYFTLYDQIARDMGDRRHVAATQPLDASSGGDPVASKSVLIEEA